MTNFTQCSQRWRDGSSDIFAKYRFTGSGSGISLETDHDDLISVLGCKAICGDGIQWYAWEDTSQTITTWVLPAIGLMIQAPFESNHLKRTIYALIRWMGSPIASLSYILWNIKVSAKCALMVDMASTYGEVPEDPNSQFAQMRDSFYILSVMNQYSIKRGLPAVETEKLIRIALFSDRLQIEPIDGEDLTIVEKRRELAQGIRAGRKRGVVPAFVSLAWFIFSLALSIQQAYGSLGQNATAHNLALGLLMSWMPVLILSSIVDRSPIAEDDVRHKLNHLLWIVRAALLNPELRSTYMKATHRTTEDFAWTEHLLNEVFSSNDLFSSFAGQGRVRWHYGVAHPILAGIEDSFIAAYGRDWLRDAENARAHLIRGPSTLAGLLWFDFRETWQVLNALVIILGTVGGAFVISFWTPTVGIGCRSGGYLIFVIIAFATFLAEMLCWIFIPYGATPQDDVFLKIGRKCERSLSRFRSPSLLSLRHRLQNLILAWNSKDTRGRIEVLFLRPMELISTGWLFYIVLAQTFGSYNNCDCMSSIWIGNSGYVDFRDYNHYLAHGAAYYWSVGTGISCFTMGVYFIVMVTEWCTQSHMNTMDFAKARHGLKATRTFKRYTGWIRAVPNAIGDTVRFFRLRILRQKLKLDAKDVKWTRHTKTKGQALKVANLDGVRVSSGKSPKRRFTEEEKEFGGFDEKSSNGRLSVESSASKGSGRSISNLRRKDTSDSDETVVGIDDEREKGKGKGKGKESKESKDKDKDRARAGSVSTMSSGTTLGSQTPQQRSPRNFEKIDL
ncbi:hypothetical protein MMC09_000543 [Bachmanniomyces sp. S44760]|nr:hypothetical protein [Bachmanniomyces sp. S44760]